MYMFNSNNAFTNDLISKVAKLVQLNKNNSLIKKLIDEVNKVDTKYKTELCKKFQSTGKCPYGYKCKFAHGKEELISKLQGVNYKKEPCKTFNRKGYCPYGSRCNEHFQKFHFHIFISNYFYLNNLTFYLLEKTFILTEVIYYMEDFLFLKLFHKQIYLINQK